MNLENGKMNRRDFLKFASITVAASLVEVDKDSQTMTLESGERIPTEKSIEEAFLKVLEGQNAKERRKELDEHGVYFWEIEFDVEDGTVELNYMRKGRRSVGGGANDTKIYVTYFGADGMPEGGTDVAVFENDKWRMT